MKTFLDYLRENHLEPGTKLKKGDEELQVVKPVGKDKYIVKEEEVVDESNRSDYSANVSMSDRHSVGTSPKKFRLFNTKTRSTRGVFDSHASAKAALANHPLKKHLVIEEVEETDESTVIRTQNGRKMVSAEVAIRLAREIAARRKGKEGEKATTTDLKHATNALRREETEQIDELSSNTLKSYADEPIERVKKRYAELKAKQKAGKVSNQENW